MLFRSLVGALVGLVAGLALCRAQQQYGFVTMGTTEGSFIVEDYPVSVHLADIAVIFLTVLATGLASVWYPVRHLCRKLL